MDGDTAPPVGGAQRSGGIPIGRLFGFPVRLGPTLLILAVFVTYTYGQGFLRPGSALPDTIAYAVGASFALLLVGSVLLHELGHAVVSRHNGIGVRGITLQMLGGYTEMERDAPRPAVELAISLAGPLVSSVLAIGAGLVAAVLPAGTIARELAVQVALSNGAVAVFNALPGLPLDGGRALQAVLWAATGDVHRARWWAGWAGRALAVFCLAGGLALWANARLTLIGLGFVVLVALTIWFGAGQALRAGRAAHQIEGLDATALARPIVAVAAGTPLSQARRYAPLTDPGPPVIAVADASGQVLALVNDAAADAVPLERRPWVPVDSLARRLDGAHLISADLRGVDLLRAVQADPHGDYLVLRGQDVIGVLRGADLNSPRHAGASRTMISRRTTR
jgi:Zn-dependent protease